MKKKSKGKASLKASKVKQKRLLKAMMRDDQKSGLYDKKAIKPKVKKVEIRKEFVFLGANRMQYGYSYARPNAETWAGGYARPYTAKRGAQRHFREWLAKGNKIEFINNY